MSELFSNKEKGKVDDTVAGNICSRRCFVVGWLVSLGLTALSDSISVRIGLSFSEWEKETRQTREKMFKQPHPHLLQAQ